MGCCISSNMTDLRDKLTADQINIATTIGIQSFFRSIGPMLLQGQGSKDNAHLGENLKILQP